MTNASDPSSSADDKALRRFAIFEQGAADKLVLATITANRTVEGAIKFNCSAKSDNVMARLSRVIEAFRVQAPATEGTEPDWEPFVALFAGDGLVVEEIPLGDANIEIHFDMQSGGIVGAHQPMHHLNTRSSKYLWTFGPKSCDALSYIRAPGGNRGTRFRGTDSDGGTAGPKASAVARPVNTIASENT
jgi:hypothetical protein